MYNPKIAMKGIQTIILCGGVGYRLKEETEFKPKPMVEVGGKPILWHIMKIYSHFGFNDFIIALGYKGTLIKDYFANQKYYEGDFALNSYTNKITHYKPESREKFRITFVDTGLESLTGERVRRVKKYVTGPQFMVTYGDGVTDMNISDLFKFHKRQKTIGTVTGVYPMLKYGGFEAAKNGKIKSFERKARIRQIINGGFMVFNKKVFDYIEPDSMIEDVYNPLIKNNQLSLFEHKGFFQSMDTYQDVQDLNNMWSDEPAWKIWH